VRVGVSSGEGVKPALLLGIGLFDRGVQRLQEGRRREGHIVHAKAVHPVGDVAVQVQPEEGRLDEIIHHGEVVVVEAGHGRRAAKGGVGGAGVVGPDEPVAVGRGRVAVSIPEEEVLPREVGGDEVEDDPHPALVGGLHQALQVL